MRYIKLGATGLEISPIAIGAMTYGEPGRGHPAWSLSEEDSRPLIKHALEAGINFFDTANMYSLGSSEEILGRALNDYANRDDVVVCTKVHGIMRAGPNGQGLSRTAIMTEIDHVSAEMSLRYGRLFDATVRTEYERALAAAKAHLGTLPTEPPQGRVSLPIVDGDWKDAPAVKARLAGGFCIRAQVQGPCAYANICEHCPNFRTDTGYLPVLAAQRADTETLARDAEARGWTNEAERHRRLIARLDTHISQTQTG
jgi:Aldo/keto reductase family